MDEPVMVDITGIDWHLLRLYKWMLLKLARHFEADYEPEHSKFVVDGLDQLVQFLDHIQSEAAKTVSPNLIYGEEEKEIFDDEHDRPADGTVC